MLREFLTEDRDELVIDLYLGESRVSGEKVAKRYGARLPARRGAIPRTLRRPRVLAAAKSAPFGPANQP